MTSRVSCSTRRLRTSLVDPGDPRRTRHGSGGSGRAGRFRGHGGRGDQGGHHRAHDDDPIVGAPSNRCVSRRADSTTTNVHAVFRITALSIAQIVTTAAGIHLLGTRSAPPSVKANSYAAILSRPSRLGRRGRSRGRIGALRGLAAACACRVERAGEETCGPVRRGRRGTEAGHPMSGETTAPRRVSSTFPSAAMRTAW
jgi:hypothetical protein